MRFHELTITSEKNLLFGTAPRPVRTARGLVIGGGHVLPELNFTLPTMTIGEETLPEVREHYRSIVREALERGRTLHAEGIVFEFETLLEMTLQPDLGVELVSIMNELCEDAYRKHGFRSEIRLTPNDTREFDRPPKARTSGYLDCMLELFERGAQAGGDLLSIESTGGKEICDDAIMYGDIRSVMFALLVLGARDMRFLWRKIVSVAKSQGKIAGGDTACGFGNTAMVLADRKMISKVFAALVRVLTVPRTLVAYEEGAVGPDKDCAYEGPFIKAITGIPISMEGKTAACAHLSPVGNVAAACCDLWSNESVQNVRLLGGMAPIVSLEQLVYDVRLMNEATDRGKPSALALRDLYTASDIRYDPQALILAPEHVIDISREIVRGGNPVAAGKYGALKALDIIEEAARSGGLLLEERERVMVELLREEIVSVPEDESAFVEMMLPVIEPGKVLLEEYGL